jgi:hypothetical protein
MATAQTLLEPVSYTEGRATADKATGAYLPDADLLQIANAARAKLRLSALGAHEGLAGVASAHARDMAIKGYVGYADQSGLSLLDQVRLADRTALIGSFASSVAVLDAGASPEMIHDAIQSDASNAENLRRGFSHAGIGSHVAGGRLYVVQLFARIDGELDQPLPLQLTGSTVIHPSLASANMTPVGWSLSDERGDLLARGGGRRIQADTHPVEGYLSLDVAVGPDIYTLRGPYVQVN